MDNKALKRLESLRGFLAHLHETLKLEFGFRLWDGSMVPAGARGGDLALAIADEGAVAALVRKPRIETLANLWATKRVDIVNGSVFDLVDRRPKMRTRDIRKVQIGRAHV